MKKVIVSIVVISMMLLFTGMMFAASGSTAVDQDGYQAEPQPALPVADMAIGATQVTWTPVVDSAGLVLTIVGPNNFYFRQQFQGDVQLTVDLINDEGIALRDGGYNYELYAIPALSPEMTEALATARESGDADVLAEMGKDMPEPLIQSGYFTVQDGSFVLPITEGGAEISATQNNVGEGINAPDDQVIADDLIVQQSACIGMDCANGENFGFDTIRLKENNLRIKFQDTSTGSFPTVDWQLTANDSTNGGANRFSIDDIDSGRTPFTIEASAPNHTLYVDSTGNIGIGTSTPILNVHITDGDTPAVRLEQNASFGYSAQTWDMAGNETNFFIRDVTHSSHLPFRIKPSAPTNSIYIDSDGDVGMGTASPAASLEVKGNDGTTQMLITENSSTATWRALMHLVNNGPAAIQVEDTDSGDYWIFGLDTDANGYFEINYNAGTPEFFIDQGGNLYLSGTVHGPVMDKQAERIVQQQKQIDMLEARLAELEGLVNTLVSESGQ